MTLYPYDIVQLRGVPRQLGVRLVVQRVHGTKVDLIHYDVLGDEVTYLTVDASEVISAISGPLPNND